MLGGKNAEMFGLMFEILVQLDGGKKSRRELSEGLGVGPQVIGRQIKLLRDVFKVTIKSSPANGYELEDWGILNKAVFMEYYARGGIMATFRQFKKSRKPLSHRVSECFHLFDGAF